MTEVKREKKQFSRKYEFRGYQYKIVDKKLQLKIILNFSIISVFTLLFSFTCLYFLINSIRLGLGEIAFQPEVKELFKAAIYNFFVLLVGGFLVVSVIVTLFALNFSLNIAGPIYGLRKIIKENIQKTQAPFGKAYFRSGDSFIELQSEYNEFIDVVNNSLVKK